MFDRVGIYERFIACHDVSDIAELAGKLGITYQTIHSWKTGKYPIPWIRLKALVDEKGLSWDYLIEGKEPMYRRHTKRGAGQPFDRHGINDRYLSLYQGYSQEKLGKELGVNQTTVFKWRHDISQVPWERLRDAVDGKGVTWDWIIEG